MSILVLADLVKSIAQMMKTVQTDHELVHGGQEHT